MVKDTDFLTKNQKTIEKKEASMQTGEIISEYNSQILADILNIDKESFEKQYDDVEEYYKEALENKDNINVILRDGEKVVGYLLAIPHNDAVEDLKSADPEFKEDKERLYVETIAVHPEYRIGGGAFKMIFTMIEEAGKRGINKFSMHVRVKGGLSAAVQKCFGKMITKVNRIENWPYYENGEPTDYVEGTYEP